MKKERKALRAKKVGITSTVVFAMLISTICVVSPVSTVIAQEDIGGEFGGDFRVALNEEPNTFNPLDTSLNDAAMQIMDLVYDSLGRVMPDTLMLEPWVAKEWTVDTDKDRNVTVILRDDVLWHDLSPVTTADVAYTFGANGYNIPYIADMTLIDDFTIVFQLDAPTALFFSEMLEMKLVPDGYTATSEIMGCGPFSFAGTSTLDIWDNGLTTRTTWTIEAFDEYFNGRPYLDSILYIYYAEGIYNWDPVHLVGTKTGAGYDLLNGTLDLIGWDLTTNESSSTPIEIFRVDEETGNLTMTNRTLSNPAEKDITLHTETGLEFRYLGMNTNRSHPCLCDKNVRMAIAHVIDKDILAAFDISGGLVVSDSIICPQVTPWFNTNLASYENDIDTANAFLNQAGYFDADNDGFRQLPGTPAGSSTGQIKLELLIPTQDEDISAPSMGDVIYKAIDQGLGLKTVVNGTLDEEARMQRVLNDDFDLFLSTEKRVSIDPGFMYDLFHSEKVSQSDPNHNMFNFEGRAREYYGVVSLSNNTTIGQMNHTNIFADGTANITAYKNGEVWGVAEGQEVWEADATPLPVDVDMLNRSIDSGYKIYRNRSLSGNPVWNVNLNPVDNEPVWNVPVTPVTNETLVSVNTTDTPGYSVASTPRTNVTEEVLTISTPGVPGDEDDLLNSPVETTTIKLWKESDTQESFNPTSLGTRNVLLVDANDQTFYPGEDLVAYFQPHIVNNSDTCDVWDVYGNSGPAQGKPDATDMAPYNIVVWVLDRGWQYEGVAEFDAADEAQVALYLAGGGNFFTSGIYYAEQSGTTPGDPAPGDFAYDYLGIDLVNGFSGNEVSVDGVAGDPAFNGYGPAFLDWTYWFGVGYFGWDSDDYTSTPAGAACMNNDDGGGTRAYGGVRMEGGTFKTVTFGFPFDTLTGPDREDAMGRILDWFVPAGGGSTGQLAHGGLANETIVNWHVWDDTAGVYLDNGTDYTLYPATGAIDFVNDLSADTIFVFYNYTTAMAEGTDYLTLNTWHYMNGKVNITISYNPAEDQIKANYTWYVLVSGGNLALANDIPPDNTQMEIRNDTYVIWWDDGGAPIDWVGNYLLDNTTGAITFNNPLGPGETVTADYTLFNPKFFGKTFTWQLAHGAGANEDIATADFHLMKNGADMISGVGFNLNTVPGTVDILAPGVLTYDDALTADYWYYDDNDMPPSLLFQLDYGALANEAITSRYTDLPDLFVNVTNAITGTVTPYSFTSTNADLMNGIFQLPVYNPGDEVNATYSYYDPADIVYTYDLNPEAGWGNPPEDCISDGTFVFYLNGGTISKTDYVIDYATGHIVLDSANVPLGPHDKLTANYNYIKYLAGGGADYSLDQSTGILTLEANVMVGDLILADYTYVTYEMVDFELGHINILNNLDPLNDTLTMSFDYRKFDELIELSNEQMAYEMRAKYIKDAQAFIAEELPCLPLFSSKVANAFNDTRYEGWDAGSMPGGILNFWTFINVRNMILGEMQVSISAFPGFVTEEEDIGLEVRVEDLDGNSIPDCDIAFDGSGTFGDVTTEWQDDVIDNGIWDYGETGLYISTFTAPQTSISRTITITATATRPSYVMGTGQVQLTVHPVVRGFDIVITRGNASIESGSETTFTIAVTDKDTQEAVSGVDLTLAVSPLGLGGALEDNSGTTDSVGEFTTVFKTANVTVDTIFTVSVTASMDGYVDKTQTSSISVSRDPNIKAAGKGFLGLPAPPFLVILILLGGLSIFYAGYRRKRFQ